MVDHGCTPMAEGIEGDGFEPWVLNYVGDPFLHSPEDARARSLPHRV